MSETIADVLKAMRDSKRVYAHEFADRLEAAARTAPERVVFDVGMPWLEPEDSQEVDDAVRAALRAEFGLDEGDKG